MGLKAPIHARLQSRPFARRNIGPTLLIRLSLYIRARPWKPREVLRRYGADACMLLEKEHGKGELLVKSNVKATLLVTTVGQLA